MSKIAACLIVKDAEQTIEPCLASIRPFVDGVFIYDTGSTDGTLKLLKKLNKAELLMCVACRRAFDPDADAEGPQLGRPGGCDCRDDKGELAELINIPLAPIVVKRGEWRDDFSWAREQSFAMPDNTFDWLLWLDDDDTIHGANELRFLADQADPTIDGYIMFYNYAQNEHGACVCQLWRERLMRRSAGYKWLNPIHEVLVPKDPEHQPMLVQLPPQLVHYIHNRPPDRYTPDRNLQILQAQYEHGQKTGEPVEPRTIAYLGTEHLSQQRWAEAAVFLQEYLERPDTGWSDERMQVAHKLATCFRALGNAHAAAEVEWQAMRERDDWAETYVGLAESYAALNQWDRTERWAKRALELGMPASALILNPFEFTFLPYLRIASACANTGRPAEALEWLEKAAALDATHPYIAEMQETCTKAAQELQLVESVLRLREALVRHDENLKALQVMENVPYLIADHPMIVKARADQREMCKHYLQPDEYLRWYQDEPKESTLTDEHIDHVGEWFGRVAGLEAGLAEQEAELGRKPLLLDLGCNDWWMGEYFARKGVRCDGVELNRASYDKAVERVKRFDREATIVHGDLHQAQKLLAGERNGRNRDHLLEHERYDAVALFEVIEHVPDIEQTLRVCESLLKPDGRVYVSTPNGAFENGNLPTWARVQRKGHLRAIPLHELAGILNAHGEIEALEQTNGDRVAFAAYKPRKKRARIAFYAGGSFEPWSPASINEGGLGGSETALTQLAVRFAQEGYEVKVYSGAEPGLYAGALFRPFSAWDPTEETDLLVVSRLPHVFDNPLGAKRTALWCHDHSYPGQMTEQRAARVDHVVVLSDWERSRYADLYPYLAEKLVVIRNGITLVEQDPSASPRYPNAAREFKERKPRCVYSSSADRGLDTLLEVWPEIRKQAPEAELHVFYGWEVFDRIAVSAPGMLAYKARVFHLADAAGGEEGGVFMRGRVGQRELAEEMQQARVWTYPSNFLETSCIGAMEARAAGLAIVTSDLAALHETVGTHGRLIKTEEDAEPPTNTTARYRKAFVRATVAALTDETIWNTWHERALAGVASFDWAHRIPEWEALVAGARQRRAKVAA